MADQWIPTPGDLTPRPTPTPGTDDASGVIRDRDAAIDPSIRNAYDMLLAVFRSYGLESLAPKILEYLQQGYGDDTITLMLSETKEYKERFAANEARVRAGMRVLSPAEYVAVEEQYRQLMRTSGLPTGFYDQASDFTNWIAGDVSPTELNDRIGIARDYVTNADPATKAALFDYYGLDEGYMVASVLDEKKALPLIEQQYRTAQIGGAARRAGLTLEQSRALEIEKTGVDAARASQGYAQIGDFLGDAQKLSDIYGGSYGQADAEAEVFDLAGSPGAQKKRKKLASQERATFGGGTGAARSAFAVNMD